MDRWQKKRILAKVRVTALITEAYKETSKRKETTCQYCGWLHFGYGISIVMMCLGLTLIILGGVLTKTDLYILGGVFLLGSLIFLIIICAPNCTRNKRAVGDMSTEVKQNVTEMSEETPRLERKKLGFIGKRQSFLRSILNTAVQSESTNKRLNSDSKTGDRSWVKMVEHSNKIRQTKVTIEEEPCTRNEFQSNTIEDTKDTSFQNNEKDNIIVGNETVIVQATVSVSAVDTTIDNQQPKDREDEGLTTYKNGHNTYRDTSEQLPSKLEKHTLNGDFYRYQSSSQITEVSVHSDPYINISNIGQFPQESNSVVDTDGGITTATEERLHNPEESQISKGQKTDYIEEMLENSEETESRRRKKKRKKKKKKKIETDLKEEVAFINDAYMYDLNEIDQGAKNDTDKNGVSKQLQDISVSQDTLERLDTDLM